MDDKKLSRQLYYAAWIIFLAAAVILAILYFNGINPLSGYTCVIYERFGLYCPGCGGTRAFMALRRFDILGAIYHNAFEVYFFAVTAVFMVTQTLDIISHGKIKGMTLRPVWFIVGIAVLIGHALLKNILALSGTGLY